MNLDEVLLEREVPLDVVHSDEVPLLEEVVQLVEKVPLDVVPLEGGVPLDVVPLEGVLLDVVHPGEVPLWTWCSWRRWCTLTRCLP